MPSTKQGPDVCVFLYDAYDNPIEIREGTEYPISHSGIPILYEDADSKARRVGALKDGNLYRALIQATIAPGQTINIGASISDPALGVRDRLKNSGSDNMLVDGSSTSVEFSIGADQSNDIKLYSLRFVMVANQIREDNCFGPISGLTNGVKVEVRSNSVTTQIALLKYTVDFFDFHGPIPEIVERGGPDDVLIVQSNFGGVKLVADSGDFVKVTIQDDLTSNNFKWFFASVVGMKVS
jgi:hypothetical protein